MTDRRKLILLLPLALTLAVTACGRKGAIEPPEGEAAAYTYPRTYPDPATMVPGDGKSTSPPPPSFPPQEFGEERTRTIIIQSQ